MSSRIWTALAGAAWLAACAQQAPAVEQAALVERGEYLVTGLGGCNDCHTPMTPDGPDMSRALQGANIIFAPAVDMPWAYYAPRLAGGPDRFDDEQLVHFLMTGLRPDGTHPTPPMPPFRLNEADARAVVAYIRSLPAAD